MCYTSVLHLHTEIPDQPQNFTVKFDNLSGSLNITLTWKPPGNSGQFDLDEYTVNVTSTSGIDNSTQVPAGTTTWQFTDDRRQRAVFNVSVTATNRCGQTGSIASTTWEYTSKYSTCL